MRTLRLVGLSADGRQVVFVDDLGAEFVAPADDRLRAALRGDRARLGQLEIEMDFALRPRDIQARIRAGDTPETVAALAQVPLDKVMPYAIPVLAERQHIAELARRGHVRRKGVDGPSRALGDVVAERLQGRGVDALAAEWDAWRRDDARWAVQASYHSGESERSALFTFDPVGRYSLAENDEAKWLTGERQSTSRGPQPREGGHAGDRRLSAVHEGDLLTLPDEAGGKTGQADPADVEASDDLTAVVRAVRETPVSAPPPPTEPATVADETSEEPAAAEDAPTEPTPQRKRRNKRASVPSWDEIMFGKDDA